MEQTLQRPLELELAPQLLLLQKPSLALPRNFLELTLELELPHKLVEPWGQELALSWDHESQLDLLQS